MSEHFHLYLKNNVWENNFPGKLFCHSEATPEHYKDNLITLCLRDGLTLGFIPPDSIIKLKLLIVIDSSQIESVETKLLK